MENDGAWSAAHFEPFNMAMRQLVALEEYTSGANSWMQKKEAVLQVCQHFHPDWRYHPDTRALICARSLCGLWLEWERGVYEPQKLVEHIRLAVATGLTGIEDWGPLDHRTKAATFTAQMALYEGGRLHAATHAPVPDTVKIWQHLYWFTRFFRAFQHITEPVSGSFYENKMKGAENARAWKPEAWAYFLKVRNERPDLTVSTIAQNYANATQTPQKKKDYENYFGWRVKLVPGAKRKKSLDKG
jgi:hypothetical protein